ncbi:hypothetical protein EOT10_33895 [Streptomyces antnestii]|uniref:Uncharacterized protein n=1 Tax=Streptomyces antnestii TaxID=2494256 RepID=A0A3S2VPG2_9ACTN|nr:hypothetical protein [Streptomyces sp. San01]RVU17623.1 hypothetical protein EOT10_33895 [Streptomyces sp. San01]
MLVVLPLQDADRLPVDDDLGPVAYVLDAEHRAERLRKGRLVEDESGGLSELLHGDRAVGMDPGAAEPLGPVHEACAGGEFGDGRGEFRRGRGDRLVGDGRVLANVCGYCRVTVTLRCRQQPPSSE